MKRNHKKAKRSNFLLAAEGIYFGHANLYHVNSLSFPVSKWCCNVLANMGCISLSPEQRMFRDLFYPGFKVASGGWWEMDEGEERILALLLCAEMLRR